MSTKIYGHALRTVALALLAFSILGSAGAAIAYDNPDIPAAYGVVSFFAWGFVGASGVCWLRRPPT